MMAYGKVNVAGTNLQAIIDEIVSKGGTVASPQRVAEIVDAISNVGNWDSVKSYAEGVYSSAEFEINISGLAFQPSIILLYERSGGRCYIKGWHYDHGYWPSQRWSWDATIYPDGFAATVIGYKESISWRCYGA